MTRRIIQGFICAGFFFLAACQGSDTKSVDQTAKTDSAYAIIGKVTGLDTGWIYIEHRQTGVVDSTALDHGFFKFSGKADTGEYCRLILNNQYRGFFLENGKISMLVKKDSVQQANISGTPIQDAYVYFQNTTCREVNNKMAIADKAYDKAEQNKDRNLMDSLEKTYEKLTEDQKQLAVNYTKAHTGSILSAYLLYSNFYYNPRLGQLDSVFQLLDTPARNTYYGLKIRKLIDKTKLTAIGNPAPEFSSNDVNGQPVSLSSFKGKYVLVDFWASWCGPCRQENPNVVKAFHRFHDKGFDILGVSLDDDKASWIKAIKKDGLDWTQVSDLKAWKADVVALYGINGIPMNYLLDKNGLIVGKGLRGADLENKLAEILH